MSILKRINPADLPVIILLAACLIIGVFIFRDYGLSHDEPLFYAYADAIGYAYSIPARLSGEFDIEQAYGPSASDHKIYGPAYLLLARNPVTALSQLTGMRKPEFWHLANFVTFLTGAAFLFSLCKRWMSSLAAFGTVLLFITQPVLWGHAFINPKDIPFMAFMLAALTVGLKMVDRLVLLAPANIAQTVDEDRMAKRRFSQRTWLILSFVLLLFFLLILFLERPLQEWARTLIQDAYNAPSTSLIGTAFHWLAPNAQGVAAEAYIAKGLVLLESLRTALLALIFLFILGSATTAFRPPSVQRLGQRARDILAPLPSRSAWWVKGQDLRKTFIAVLLPGIMLGLVTSIRVIGPLAGLLVLLYFLLRSERRSIASLGIYALIAIVVAYLTWPFLWDAPIQRFSEVLRHMASNPQILSVLFNGTILASDKLPPSYLPVMLGITLTLPALALFFIGLLAAVLKIVTRQIDWRSLGVVLTPLFLYLLYVAVLTPPMYDGYRHSLFILPMLFILAGLGIQQIIERLKQPWTHGLLLFLVAFPGIYGLISHHPYPYTYYNALVGGTQGAFRRFETDFWLTCYKEAMQEHINPDPEKYPEIYVLRNPAIAAYYASAQVDVLGYDPEVDQPVPGQKTLLTTRTNVDQTIFPDAPVLFSVGLKGADFCVVKQSQ